MPDSVKSYSAVRPTADYVRREVMIPMRDGAKLFTVIVMRKGVTRSPILLSRTPYDATRSTWRNLSQRITEVLPVLDAEFVNDDYIRVYQDVRGLGRSEGEYMMARPLRGPVNKSPIDHSTDAYDTIEWLVKHVPEGNGRVGIVGSSYQGTTALMALVDPHPALKAAAPQSPLVDGWIGDDWFHNGAFRQNSIDYIMKQTARENPGVVPYGTGDDYLIYLSAGSAGDFARTYGADAFPFVRKIMEHPTYDWFWESQALDKILGSRKLTVPTMLITAQWDQEDSYGAPAVYRALEPQDKNNDLLHFVIGPWRHSGVNYDGWSLAALTFPGDTALQFRRDFMKPFFDKHLKETPSQAQIPPVLTYATGIDQWQVAQKWPLGTPTPLYLSESFGLSLGKPPLREGNDSYVSDPAKPVPYVRRPIRQREPGVWWPWLATDQRFVSDRPDVLTYVSPPLESDVQIAGAPLVDLFAATSGTDSDWVVKLIDVYPEELSTQPQLAGYQLPIGIDIFRGRYVDSFAKPRPLKPGQVERYRFSLPDVNHVFRKGHRMMVQVQSSLFPLYDRNPQTFVPNIFHAKANDYRKATQRTYFGGRHASAIWLPVVSQGRPPN